MAKQKNRKLFFWTASIVWMAAIFFLSSMKGSGYSAYSPIYFVERKTFHVIEYFILAMLFFGTFYQYFVRKKALIYSASFALIYAVSDEWHQTFIFGRDGTIRDVVIDFLGVITAVIFIWQFEKWKRKREKLS